MDRKQLLDDIQVLSSLLARAAAHAKRAEDADERDAHIEMQASRLEEAAIKIERRRIELDAHEDSDPDYELFAQERATLDTRLQSIRDKIDKLRQEALENEVFDAAAFAARPEGVPARLRWTLRALVDDLHSDPLTTREDIRPFQARLAELVRERRARIHEASERIGDARGYMTSAVSLLEDLRESSDTMSELLPGESWPFEAQRTLCSTRIEMARVALRESHSRLVAIAHDWPEAAPLARLPDWKRIPFVQLQAVVAPPKARETVDTPFARSLGEAWEMSRAVALWIQELREQVDALPPPL